MIEVVLAFLAGVVVAVTSRETKVQDPSIWMRAAARSGVTIKVKTTEKEGEWILGFSFDMNPDELRKRALSMRKAGRKVEAVQLVREYLDMDLKGAKEYVENLLE